MPIGTLLRRLRGPSQEDLLALRAYREAVEPSLDRLRAVRDEWLALSRDVGDQEWVANTAAKARWELARLGQRAAEIHAPTLADTSHRDLLRALNDAARGCQLLATGTRSHKSEAVCDGQALLVEAAEAADRIGRGLDASLSGDA